MKNIKWIFNEPLPMEMHKARIVQKINLLEPKKRLEAIKEAGFNTFLLKINIFSFLRQYCIFIKHNFDSTQLKYFK